MAVNITERFSTADYHVGGDEAGCITVSAVCNLGTYATGGVALVVADFGTNTAAIAGSIVGVIPGPASTGDYVFSWDQANAKIKAWNVTDTTEASGGDLAAQTFECLFLLTR